MAGGRAGKPPGTGGAAGTICFGVVFYGSRHCGSLAGAVSVLQGGRRYAAGAERISRPTPRRRGAGTGGAGDGKVSTVENPQAVLPAGRRWGRPRQAAGMVLAGPLLALALGGPLVAEEMSTGLLPPVPAGDTATATAAGPDGTALPLPPGSGTPQPGGPRAAAGAAHTTRNPAHPGHGHSRDQVRQLVQHGEVRPLKDVLTVARREIPGEILRIRLHRRNGTGHPAAPATAAAPAGPAAAGGAHWVYEVRILDTGGHRRDLVIDGRTLAVLERK